MAKWEQGTLLDDLPTFQPRVKPMKNPEEAAMLKGREHVTGQECDVGTEGSIIEVKEWTRVEAENEGSEMVGKETAKTDFDILAEIGDGETYKPPKNVLGLHSDSCSGKGRSKDDYVPRPSSPLSSALDEDLKQGIDGYFRSCVITPAKRNLELERSSRQRRAAELNELGLRVFIGKMGGHLEDSFAPAMPSSGKNDGTEIFGPAGILGGWDERPLDLGGFESIVKRALEIATLSNKDDESHEHIPITWAHLQDAWRMQHLADEERKLWMKSNHPASDQENAATAFDKLLETLKSEDRGDYGYRFIDYIVDVARTLTLPQNIQLPAQTLDSICSLVSLPLLHSQAFCSGILHQKTIPGVLLFGPPGTGKELTIHSLAKESGFRVIAIKPFDITGQNCIGASQLVQALFKFARRLQPCVIFIDEIDSLLTSPMNGSYSTDPCVHVDALEELLRQLDGLNDPGVVVIGATSRPFDLSNALLRRLPFRFLFDLPSLDGREEILKHMLLDEQLSADVIISELATKTDGFSGSDLKNLCVTASIEALKETVDLPWLPKEPEIGGAMIPQESSTEKKPESLKLAARHFAHALTIVAPWSSECRNTLIELRKWNARFGTRPRNFSAQVLHS
ncbi:AAA family ATPase [Ceratobasidium sp. AG-Ba]|nr:AAA family ATPase [Ceratobasidium sp. AG-Ba]